MVGTAFPADRVVLIEQPGGWGPEGLSDSRFDRAIARRLADQLGTAGVRLMSIRRPGRSPRPDRRAWAYADCAPGRRSISWGSFGADADLLELLPRWISRPANDGPAAQPESGQPISYLVCAHGTHDVCCAVEGRPVAAALERLRPGQVWECSHLGGDRFAANVAVLPTGVVYGRVPESAVADLIAATDRGELVTGLLRGRVGWPPTVQAALAFAHQELAEPAVDHFTPVGQPKSTGDGTGQGDVVVRLRSSTGTVEVRVGVQREPAHRLTCRALRPSGSLSYRLLSVRAVPVDG
ncbi:hypothetical protein BH10ACT8_BH10ACT8_21580 [soil metagenome]